MRRILNCLTILMCRIFGKSTRGGSYTCDGKFHPHTFKSADTFYAIPGIGEEKWKL